MRVYIRKDLAESIPDLTIADTRMADLESTANMYEPLSKLIPAAQLLSPGFNTPRNLAFGPDGSIYVADTGNHRVVHLDLTGQILNTWGSQTPANQVPPAPGTFNEPWGITVDPQGNVYVADTWNHRIQKFSADGTFLLEWGTGGVATEGSSLFWGPRSVAVDPESGNVYVTDTGNKRVAVFDANGTFLFDFGLTEPGMLNEPVGLAIDPNGIVYVADTWNLRVVSFTLDGQYLSDWRVYGWNSDTLDNKPYIAVDASGRVYVTDPEGYRVIGFEPGGEALVAFGQYGQEPESFALPIGIAIAPDGKVWIADAGNNRLAAFVPLEPETPPETSPGE
jgi:DNA-binding beta-propeller fold protein YncE